MPPLVKNPTYIVTDALVAARVMKEEYIRLPGSTGTICILTIENGFMVTGESFCANPAHFDEAIGKLIAKKDAQAKLWELESYLAAERNYLDNLHK